MLFTLTDKSLFGAVNPKDGSIVWRQQLHSVSNSSNAVLRAGGDNVLATAAGSQVATWQASDGRLIWSHDYGQDVVVKDAIFLGVKGEGSAIGSQDILVLYQGASSGIERRDLETGEVKWQYTDARYGYTDNRIHHGADSCTAVIQLPSLGLLAQPFTSSRSTEQFLELTR